MTEENTKRKVLTPVGDTIIVLKWEDVSRLGPTLWEGGETGGSCYGKRDTMKKKERASSLGGRGVLVTFSLGEKVTKDVTCHFDGV